MHACVGAENFRVLGLEDDAAVLLLALRLCDESGSALVQDAIDDLHAFRRVLGQMSILVWTCLDHAATMYRLKGALLAEGMTCPVAYFVDV